jgi:hypothetical protein
MSGSLVANPKSGPDLFSVYHEIIYIFFNFTYPLRCLRVPPGVRVPQVEYHWCIGPRRRISTLSVKRHRLTGVASFDCRTYNGAASERVWRQ